MKKMRKVIKIGRKGRKRELWLGYGYSKMTKRELFFRIMRELGKSEDILVRENGTKIRI